MLNPIQRLDMSVEVEMSNMSYYMHLPPTTISCICGWCTFLSYPHYIAMQALALHECRCLSLKQAPGHY